MKKEDEKRTVVQNASLHLFFKQVSDEFIAGGIDLKMALKENFEIPVTEGIVKEVMWKQVQKAMLGKDHTADLTKKELQEIYDLFNLWLGEKHHIHVPWPSEEEVYYRNKLKGDKK